MTALATAPLKVLFGHAKPRIAPPLPARHDLAAFRESSVAMGITLMPWQEQAARYLTARGRDGLLYREVCIVVARQNGKTTLMKPHIIRSLRAGKKITHIAQNRELPRDMFGIIADALSDEPELFPKRRGKTIWPRFGAGQEDIQLVNGGRYRIAASSRGGGRGWPNDIIIYDELREQRDFLAIAAGTPTLTMSDDPQTIYLSNMGDDDSVVLNEVRERAGSDPSLGYLEWSAASERDAGDQVGWAESNPAMGHYPSVLRTLEKAYRKAQASPDLMAIFETEHLCRAVPTMAPRLVEPALFEGLLGDVAQPSRPVMGAGMAPDGSRAAAAMAWRQRDGRIAVMLEADVTGSPVDLDAFGADLKLRAAQRGIRQTGFDDWTDKGLARYLRDSHAIIGKEFANATARFVQLVQGRQLVWAGSGGIAADLAWTSRKDHESGGFIAVPASDDHAIPAVLAAIRAVWLASEPRPGAPRVL